MAITSSAKKALRASKRRHVFNLRRKSAVDKSLKNFRKLVASKSKAEAQKMMPALYKVLDKAAKTGYLKVNTAARLKSRATVSLNKIA